MDYRQIPDDSLEAMIQEEREQMLAHRRDANLHENELRALKRERDRRRDPAVALPGMENVGT